MVMFVAFAGIDGSGKSTAAATLTSQLKAARTFGAFHLNKRDFMSDHSSDNRQLRLHGEALWSDKQGARGVLWGNDYWYHLQVSWFSLLDEIAVRPALARRKIVVADDWYYKILARFLAKGGRWESEAHVGFSRLTRPDLVVMLDIPPDSAADRLPRFSFAEMGGFDDGTEPGRDGFIRYQSTVRNVLYGMAKTEGWRVLPSDTLTPEQIASRTMQWVTEYCDPSPSAAAA